MDRRIDLGVAPAGPGPGPGPGERILLGMVRLASIPLILVALVALAVVYGTGQLVRVLRHPSTLFEPPGPRRPRHPGPAGRAQRSAWTPEPGGDQFAGNAAASPR